MQYDNSIQKSTAASQVTFKHGKVYFNGRVVVVPPLPPGPPAPPPYIPKFKSGDRIINILRPEAKWMHYTVVGIDPEFDNLYLFTDPDVAVSDRQIAVIDSEWRLA